MFLLTACTVALGPVGQASAQTVARNPDGTISVTASELPLGQVLRAVGTVSPFERLAIEPSAEGRPVTVSLANLSVEEALTAILRNAGVNYVSAGAARLAVGDSVMLASLEQAKSTDGVRTAVEQAHVDTEPVEHDLGERPARAEPDPSRDEPEVEQRRAELETVLVRPPGTPAYRPGFAVLPGENGGTTVVPVTVGAPKPNVALPGLGADPFTKPGAPQPSATPVPPGLQPLLGPPIRKASSPGQ